MVPDPHALQIFVDGSCAMHSKRESGYAGFALYPGESEEQEIICHGVRQSTNQRMELSACIAAMEWVREAKGCSLGVQRVEIFTDSRYLTDNISRAPYWLKNKGRNTHGRPLDNLDLWKELFTAKSRAGVRVDFGWVPGKSSA